MNSEFLKRNVHRVVCTTSLSPSLSLSLRQNMRITFPRRRQTRTRHFQDKCAIWSQWQNSTTRFQLGWKCLQLPHVQPCTEERDSTAASKPIKNANNEASSLQEILATENTGRATEEENEPPALRSPRTRTRRRIIASFPSRMERKERWRGGREGSNCLAPIPRGTRISHPLGNHAPNRDDRSWFTTVPRY